MARTAHGIRGAAARATSRVACVGLLVLLTACAGQVRNPQLSAIAPLQLDNQTLYPADVEARVVHAEARHSQQQRSFGQSVIEKMHDAGGHQTGAWGAASQSGGQGSWAIQGTAQSGTISVRYADGSTATIEYRQGDESGCLYFDGNQLCRTSAECE